MLHLFRRSGLRRREPGDAHIVIEKGLPRAVWLFLVCSKVPVHSEQPKFEYNRHSTCMRRAPARWLACGPPARKTSSRALRGLAPEDIVHSSRRVARVAAPRSSRMRQLDRFARRGRSFLGQCASQAAEASGPTTHRPHIDPTSSQYRPEIDPQSTQHQPKIDPRSTHTPTPTTTPDRPKIVPNSSQYWPKPTRQLSSIGPKQPQLNPRSTQTRTNFVPKSTQHQPKLDPKSTQPRPIIEVF